MAKVGKWRRRRGKRAAVPSVPVADKVAKNVLKNTVSIAQSIHKQIYGNRRLSSDAILGALGDKAGEVLAIISSVEALVRPPDLTQEPEPEVVVHIPSQPSPDGEEPKTTE